MSSTLTFNPNGIFLKELEFTEKEKQYFQNQETDFSAKYEGAMENNLSFSLLIIGSKSWKTHHNPEICIKGLGYKIAKSQIVQINEQKLRQVNLESGDKILYWFANGVKTVPDYSERVWESILNPNEEWYLIEIGLKLNTEPDHPEVIKLIDSINENISKSANNNLGIILK